MKTSCCYSKKIHQEKDYAVCINVRCDNYMRPTSTYSVRRWNNVSFSFFVFFFFFMSFSDFSYNTSQKFKTSSLSRTSHVDIRPLTEENLRKELDSNHIICPEQVFAQIMIESGHLSSYLTKRTNNLLGMRYPFKRQTSATGIFLPNSNLVIKGTQNELKKYRNKNTYAVYDSWEDCVKDYKYWQDQSFKLKDIYLAFLGNCYAEDSLYIMKIKSMAK